MGGPQKKHSNQATKQPSNEATQKHSNQATEMTTTTEMPFGEPLPQFTQELQQIFTEMKKKHLALQIQRLWRGHKSRRGDTTPCRLCQHPICLPKKKANGYNAEHCSWCLEYIDSVENEYILWQQTPKKNRPDVGLHYCGEFYCTGDCGVLSCGCIDVCRGRCGAPYGFRSWD